MCQTNIAVAAPGGIVLTELRHGEDRADSRFPCVTHLATRVSSFNVEREPHTLLGFNLLTAVEAPGVVYT